MKNLLLEQYQLVRVFIKAMLIVLILLLVYNFSFKVEGEKLFFHNPEERLYDTLKTNHYTLTFIDKIMLAFTEAPEQGLYYIPESSYNRLNFFRHISNYKILSKPVTLYAGESASELTNRLAKQLDMNASKLYDAYKKETRFGDGDIFSGTYTLPQKVDEASLIHYLFTQSDKILQKFETQYAKISTHPMEHEILLIIASIIQKESNKKEEMPLIASVIYNRLEKNMKLQMDGTLNYGKYSHQIVNAKRIKEDSSDYNTYKNKGLPPAPLCTISIEALEAAYLPESTDYLFFMLTRKGTHAFASEYKTHLKNIRAFKHKKSENNHTILNTSEE